MSHGCRRFCGDVFQVWQQSYSIISPILYATPPKSHSAMTMVFRSNYENAAFLLHGMSYESGVSVWMKVHPLILCLMLIGGLVWLWTKTVKNAVLFQVKHPILLHPKIGHQLPWFSGQAEKVTVCLACSPLARLDGLISQQIPGIWTSFLVPEHSPPFSASNENKNEVQISNIHWDLSPPNE